jgi:choline dehydrogenase
LIKSSLLIKKFGEAAAFVRTDDPVLFPESQFPEKLSDTASAKDSPDLELFVTPAGYKVSLCATTMIT